MWTEAHVFDEGEVLIRRQGKLEGTGVGGEGTVDEFFVSGFEDADGCEAEWVSGEGVDDGTGEGGLGKGTRGNKKCDKYENREIR